MSFPCVRILGPAGPTVPQRNVVLLVSCVLGVWFHTAEVLAQPGPPGTSTKPLEHSAIDLLRPETIGSTPAVEHEPATIAVDRRLQSLVDDLLQRSPAFRRQWHCLMGVRRLSIRIELVHAHHVGDADAATQVSVLPDGSLLAVIAIPGGLRLAELIAHEVEHVLERLDGVKVASRHALGDRSVRRGSATFETARAVLVGQMVAGEYRRR